MTDPSSSNKKLIEENAILRKKVQELEELGSKSKQMKAALRESEENYRTLIKKIQTAVVVHGPDTRILTSNPMAQEILGLTEAQLLGKTAIDEDWHFFNADETIMDVEEYPVNQVIAKRQPLRNFVAGVHHPNKEPENDVWVLINANPVMVNDEIVQVIVTFVDITDRKREQEALRESERKYRNLYHYAHVGLFETGLLDAKIIACNQRYCDLAGFPTVDSAIGMDTIHLYTNPSDREEVKRLLKEQGCITDHVLQLKNRLTGAIFWAEFSARTNPSRDIIEGTIIDISERMQAELLRQEAFDIIEKSPVATFLWRNETDWPVEFVTRNIGRIFGYSNADFLSGRILYSQAIHPDDLERVAQEVATYSQEPGRTAFVHEPYRIVAPDNTVRWVNDQTFIRRDHTGAITHYEGIVEDITARKQMEADLLAEKERLAVTLRSIGDAVITTDRDGRVVLMNPIAEDLTGWSEADAAGRPLMQVFRIVDERTREPCANPLDKVLSTGQIVGLANHTLLLAKDGREFTIADSGAPIRDSRGDILGVVLVFRDTTERQRMENELLKMEKLKSLGVLAGGIAHDFNNFLAGIIGNLSLAKLDVQPAHPVSRALGEMEKAALRAKDLTQQLLTFSKGGEPVKQITRIDELVRESAQFALRGSNVRCEFKIDNDLRPADVDDGQIAQVIHNLVINADQAMPDGGAVRIRGLNISLGPGNPYTLDPGDYIQLSFQDQGTGIKREYLKKLFDPYFTTKQKGSGLGLAVAYSIVARHDGQLTVDSTLGKGTTFTLMLPASQRTQAVDIPAPDGLIVGSGRILVMDDEDFIRELATAMLQKMGYNVALAEDGQQAVALYREALEAGKPFDAVILDLTIPGGKGGKETMRRLSALDPNVRAIVSSGYSSDPIMANHARYGFCGAVKKPYLVQEMSQVLNTVIKK